MGTFSIWHWIIVLAIVVLVFGTKKLRNLGSDLGGALKGFKDGMKEQETESTPFPSTHTTDSIMEVEAKKNVAANTFKASIKEEHNIPAPPMQANTTTENNASQLTGTNNPIIDAEIKEKQPKA